MHSPSKLRLFFSTFKLIVKHPFQYLCVSFTEIGHFFWPCPYIHVNLFTPTLVLTTYFKIFFLNGPTHFCPYYEIIITISASTYYFETTTNEHPYFSDISYLYKCVWQHGYYLSIIQNCIFGHHLFLPASAFGHIIFLIKKIAWVVFAWLPESKDVIFQFWGRIIFASQTPTLLIPSMNVLKV